MRRLQERSARLALHVRIVPLAGGERDEEGRRVDGRHGDQEFERRNDRTGAKDGLQRSAEDLDAVEEYTVDVRVINFIWKGMIVCYFCARLLICTDVLAQV